MDVPTPRDPPDTLQLLDAWHQGDAQALASLVQLYSEWIRAYVRKRMNPLVRRIEGSDDVIQTVLFKFLRTGPRFRPRNEREFKALLGRAVTNRILDLVDKVPGSPSDTPLGTAVSQIGVGISTSDRPDRRAEIDEERSFVALALQLIKPDDRQIINLREWRGLDYPEIARLLGISADTARMRFNHALVRLGREVQKLKRGETEEWTADVD